MKVGFKLGAIATALSIASLSLIPSSALAVPGWAQTSRRMDGSARDCTNFVQNAIRKVTGANGTFGQLNGTTYLMTTYPQGTTGVFIYCVYNPEQSCGQATSSVMLVAFSDRGSGEAAAWRDRLDRAIGSPQRIDCG
ncbi:MAG: hypothetical protein WCA35_07145 [Kovacikia sp.]